MKKGNSLEILLAIGAVLLTFGAYYIFKKKSVNEEADRKRRLGDECYSLMDYSKAIMEYTEALDLLDAPDSDITGHIYSSRADCYMKTKCLDKAILDYTSALDSFGLIPWLLLKRATVYEESGCLRAAFQDIFLCCMLGKEQNNEVIQKAATILEKLCCSLVEEEIRTLEYRLPNKKQTSEFLNSFSPVNLCDHPQLSNSFISKDYEKCYEYLKLEEIEGRLSSSLMRLYGMLLLLMRKGDKAMRIFECILEKEEDHHIKNEIRVLLLFLECGDGSSDQILLRLKSITDPIGPIVLYHLAEFYITAKDPQTAINLYDQCIKLDKEYFRAYICKCRVLIGSGHILEAKKVIEDASNLFPNNEGIMTIYGEILLCNGEFLEGREIFDKLLENDSENPSLIFNRGMAVLPISRPEAIEYFKLAIEKDPGLIFATVNLTKASIVEDKFSHKALNSSLDLLSSSIKYANSPADLYSIYLTMEIVKAQMEVIRKYPGIIEEMDGHNFFFLDPVR